MKREEIEILDLGLLKKSYVVYVGIYIQMVSGDVIVKIVKKE